MVEIWRDIVGYEGLYRVSNLGRVYSVPRISRQGNRIGGKFLKPGKQVGGYLFVNLVDSYGNTKTHRVHRLVALMFIPNIMNYPQVDHRDTNKDNNTVSNLTWVNSKGNRHNPITYKKSSDSRKGKPLTEATKAKISQANKGELNSFYGKKHSTETRELMREIWAERKRQGYTNPNSKPVMCVETGEVFKNSTCAAKTFAGDYKAIKNCCNGKGKTSGGYHWKWYEEDSNNE